MTDLALTARLRKAALWYAQRGWPVLPLHSPRLGGCTCRNDSCPHPGKHPRTEHGVLDASTDLGAITQWWNVWPVANIAIATGAASGAVVLDCDRRHDGETSLAKLEREFGPLPETPRVRTGGGNHWYFAAHPGGTLRSRTAFRPGLDFRAGRASVTVPPSQHAAGVEYVWEIWPHHVPLAPLPEWLRAVVDPPPPPPRPDPRPFEGDPAPYVAAAIRGELQRIENAPEGARNHTLNRAAFAVGQFVGSDLVPEAWATEQLEVRAIKIGLPAFEARRTVKSGLRGGMAHPRDIPHD